jgi:hypothetical protein
MDQISAVGMMKKIVPITRFNKGEASKIFDEVQKKRDQNRCEKQSPCLCAGLSGSV